MDKNNYKNIFGDTEKIINAIQKFLEKGKEDEENLNKIEESSELSINKIIDSVVDKEVNEAIKQIIDKI